MTSGDGRTRTGPPKRNKLVEKIEREKRAKEIRLRGLGQVGPTLDQRIRMWFP